MKKQASELGRNIQHPLSPPPLSLLFSLFILHLLSLSPSLSLSLSLFFLPPSSFSTCLCRFFLPPSSLWRLIPTSPFHLLLFLRTKGAVLSALARVQHGTHDCNTNHDNGLRAAFGVDRNVPRGLQNKVRTAKDSGKTGLCSAHTKKLRKIHMCVSVEAPDMPSSSYQYCSDTCHHAVSLSCSMTLMHYDSYFCLIELI